jgi:hypothetical protein
MDRIREWSFPVAVLTLWVVAAGYTLTSLGHAHAAAQKPVARIQATQEITVVASKRVSLARDAQKPVVRRGPRA